MDVACTRSASFFVRGICSNNGVHLLGRAAFTTHILTTIRERVCHIEKQEVDIRHGQKLRVLTHDPRIICVIVAVQRLGKPVHGARRTVFAAGHIPGLNAHFVDDLL